MLYHESMSAAPSSSVASAPVHRGSRMIKNVLWSWLGVGISLASGILLSPYLIRKLGAEGYGIWALIFSVVGYYALVDLGFRSAVVRYTAHYHAKGDAESINAVINTGLVYFSLASIVLVGVTLYLWRSVHRFFQVSPALQDDFSRLILIVGISWGLSLNCSLFGGCLEGFQRFDISSRIWIASMTVRTLGCFVLLALGFGLTSLGCVAFASQVTAWVFTYTGFRKIFPSLRISPSLAALATLRKLAHYGLHTFLANVATMLLNFAYPLLIGHFLPVAFVGYYSLPGRLLQYTGDAVSKVGLVTAANAAELQAKGGTESISRLGIYTNRYCLALYMPLAIVLAVYGQEVLSAWVGGAFAAYSAPILPVMLLGVMIAQMGQFNSGTILFGLAKHDKYAYGLLVEAAVDIILGFMLIPRFGIIAAAWIATGSMIVVRGLYTPWLACRHLRFSFSKYMSGIFLRPVVTAIPLLALTYLWKIRVMSGGSLRQLFVVGVGVAALFYAAAAFTIIKPEHRTLFLARLGNLLPWGTKLTQGA